MDNKKKTVLVTGCSRGIGLALCEHYLERGMNVIGVARTLTEIKHDRFLFLELDITNEAAVQSQLSVGIKHFGGLDALINNAGRASMNHTLLTPVSMMEHLFEVNCKGAFLVTREAVKALRKSSSPRIINFSTIAVPLRLEGEAMYGASKSYIEYLTKVWAKEFSAWKITVNCVAPGPVATDLIKNVPTEKIEHILRQQIIPRRCEFADIFNVVDFFLQKESEMISGQVIQLGGCAYG